MNLRSEDGYDGIHDFDLCLPVQVEGKLKTKVASRRFRWLRYNVGEIIPWDWEGKGVSVRESACSMGFISVEGEIVA